MKSGTENKWWTKTINFFSCHNSISCGKSFIKEEKKINSVNLKWGDRHKGANREIIYKYGSPIYYTSLFCVANDFAFGDKIFVPFLLKLYKFVVDWIV